MPSTLMQEPVFRFVGDGRDVMHFAAEPMNHGDDRATGRSVPGAIRRLLRRLLRHPIMWLGSPDGLDRRSARSASLRIKPEKMKLWIG